MTCTLLGTGSSGGVPRVGGDWGTCDPDEPRNRRRRCCILIDLRAASGALTRVLIDTSPDLREQLLDQKVTHLDAVVYTHDHADQAHGIDDIRPLVIRAGRPVPTYMDEATRASLTHRFAYCFEGRGGYPPIMDLQPAIRPGVAFEVSGAGGVIRLLPLDMQHGRIRSLGFRVGAFAYCNDVNELPLETMARLRGLDTLVVDALRHTPHPSHAHLDKSLGWIEELAPKRAVLTNLHVDMDYATLRDTLPAHIVPAYDGMQIDIRI